MEFIRNVPLATALFNAALVADALSALDPTDHGDVPASLRSTGLVLALLLAGPRLEAMDWHVFPYKGALQRPLLAVLLVLTALGGIHHGGVGTRVCDATYVLAIVLAAAGLTPFGGVDASFAQTPRAKDAHESSVALALALELYGSARLLRAGAFHAQEVLDFQVDANVEAFNATAFRVSGYAYAADAAAAALSFGGGVGVAAALVTLPHVVTQAEDGAQDGALVFSVAGLAQAAAAVVATLSVGDQIDTLTAAFGEGACAADTPACAAAAASRRFAVANGNVAALWLSALGLLALAFPPAARAASVEALRRARWSWTGYAVVIAACGGAAAAVALAAPFTGSGARAETALLLVLGALLLEYVGPTEVGLALFVGASLWEEARYATAEGSGAPYAHAPHVAYVTTLALLGVHVVLGAALPLARGAGCARGLEAAVGGVATAALSLGSALALTGAALLAAASGRTDAVLDAAPGGTRAAVSFLLHFATPLFAALPLWACRHEAFVLTTRARAAVWLGAGPVAAVVYGAALLAGGPRDAAEVRSDGGPLAVAAVAVVALPWLAASAL